VRSDDLLFLAEEGSIRTYMLADASRLRAYEGKKVRISGALESPHVIVVRTSMVSGAIARRRKIDARPT
jgi:hypothetical protein